jgi:transposase
MGEDGAALPGKTDRPRTKQERQLALCRSGGTDRAHWQPRRDLPAFFGKWNTVFKPYRDRVKADVFVRLFEACSDEPDTEYAMIDATIVKVTRHGQGAKGGLRAGHRLLKRRSDDQDLRVLTDVLGNPVRLILLPGRRFDAIGARPLIDGLSFGR